MTFKFHCIHCSQHISATDEDRGVRSVCPGCGQEIVVPGEPMKVIAEPARQARVPAGGAAPSQGGWIVGAVCLVILLGAFVMTRPPRAPKPEAMSSAAPKVMAGRTPDGVAPEAKPGPQQPPPEDKQVLGGSRRTVDALLGGWTIRPSTRKTPGRDVVFYSQDVEMIVTYREDRATGVTVMVHSSSGAPPITRERLFQLSRLIGQTPADANTKREGDGIVEFSVGEN